MLRRAIESCVKQTLPVEIVVVDEASTDRTAEVAQSFPAVKYIRNEVALGHSSAANRGIREARGEWIKSLDDDDWLAANCIEAMDNVVSRAEQAGFHPVLVSAPAVNMDEQEREIGRSRSFSGAPAVVKSRDLLEMMMFDQAPVGTPVQVGFSRKAALDCGGWNEHRQFKHQHGDEVELWIKLAAQGDIVFLPSHTAFRTIWSGGSQDVISPEDRYHSNVYLKDLIAAVLGTETPERIKSYLALHWALVAAKNRDMQLAYKLDLIWIKHPTSVKYLFRKNRPVGRYQPL